MSIIIQSEIRSASARMLRRVAARRILIFGADRP
jgi:hypothetical protein